MKSKLKSGYKSSPLGVIPDDWEVKSVSEAFQICNNLRLPISQEERDKMKGKYPYYGPTKIQDYIRDFRVEGKYTLIGEDGDHFLKWRELPMTLLVEGKFNVNNHAHLIKGNENLTEWFHYYFNHKELTPYLTRQGAGRYKLTKESLSKIPIPLPTPEEQIKITRLFLTWDQGINNLNQCITQKELRKKWLMQKLLTEKKRLKGFNGKWRETIFSEVGNIPMKTPITRIDNQKLLTVKLHTKGIEFNASDKPIISATGRPYYERKYNEILIGRQNIHNGGIGLVTKEFAGHICSNAITSFLVNERENSTLFILYYLSFPEHYKRIENFMGGTGQKELSERQFLDVSIKIPLDKEEQIAIVNILLVADKELQLLRQKLDKLKEQKKGLMQVLLTGKKRLKL